MELLQELKNGNTVLFSNEEHQLSIREDNIRIARVEFEQDNSNDWANGFKIWFNGKLIHSSKTFKSLQNRLDKLIDKWNLKQTEIEE